MKPQFSVLISTCDKFSDLWETHIALYTKNYEGHLPKTYLVTDKKTNRCFDNVEIIVAGESLDFPMRIKYALQFIETEYILVTLDDYFITSKVKEDNLNYLTQYASENSVDYLMLYDRFKAMEKFYLPLNNIEFIDLSVKYAITLYPSIWKKTFLNKTIKENISPWLYEVSLTQTARQENAKCMFSPSGCFDILDVVRKGKILHKAKRYFKKIILI